MHEDTKQELERLERALLEEETVVIPRDDALLDACEEQESENVQIYNTDRTDTDLEEFSDAVMEGESKSLMGLVITAAVLTAAVAGVLIFWLIRYGGLIA